MKLTQYGGPRLSRGPQNTTSAPSVGPHRRPGGSAAGGFLRCCECPYLISGGRHHRLNSCETTCAFNRAATRESFIAIAEKGEGEEWFSRNKLLRELLVKHQGIDIANLGIEVGELDSAKMPPEA